MSDQDKLQNMLDNLINQKPEQAQVDFHDYLQGKMQEVLGTQPDPAASEEESDEE